MSKVDKNLIIHSNSPNFVWANIMKSANAKLKWRLKVLMFVSLSWELTTKGLKFLHHFLCLFINQDLYFIFHKIREGIFASRWLESKSILTFRQTRRTLYTITTDSGLGILLLLDFADLHLNWKQFPQSVLSSIRINKLNSNSKFRGKTYL